MVMVHKTQKVVQARFVTEVVGGKQVNKQVTSEVERTVASYVTLTDRNARFATAAGTPVAAGVALKRAADGLTVLVSADGKPVDRWWLRGVDPDAVVVTSEALVGVGGPRSTVQVPTLAPRLALLGTGADGQVQVPYNPVAGASGLNNSAVGNRVVFLNNGAGQMPIFLNDDGSYTPNPTPAAGAAPVKPLADVRFDAYDRAGKLVRREDTLARLAAGGLVLVADDNRLPDESYLKLFRGDLLVLVSPELANVPTGAKGKPVAAVGPAIAAAPVQAIPLPLVAPAAPVMAQRVIVQAAAIKPVAMPAKKAVEKAPAPVEKGTR
jgi:hypothetical protein